MFTLRIGMYTGKEIEIPSLLFYMDMKLEEIINVISLNN
jgi:hypothetical protein